MTWMLLVALAGYPLLLLLWWRSRRPGEPRLNGTFRDTAGRLWTLRITVDDLRRVKALCGVDLLELVQPKQEGEFGRLIGRLLLDPVLLVDVIYCVAKPVADARGIDDVQFGRGLGGDSIEQAIEALIAGVIDFFPNRRDRWRMKRLVAATWKAAGKAQRTIDQTLTPRATRELIERALSGPTPGSSSTSWPASAAATLED